VHALYAEQFAGVPATRATDRITLLEEERITAYYGAGMLYADPGRAESIV
jgi:photosynthetic reaction center H subunit